jgi:hypothetical protein
MQKNSAVFICQNAYAASAPDRRLHLTANSTASSAGWSQPDWLGTLALGTYNRTMNHLRQLTVKLVAVAALGLGLVACGNTPPITSSLKGTTTTIILVRHAERDPGTDPPLNSEGQTRAQTLAQTLGQNGVTAIYATNFLRNRQTAEPLAKKLGLTVSTIGIEKLSDTKALASELVNTFLTNHAGGVVLWIGNVGVPAIGTNGTLDDIYTLLGGTGTPPNRYQDLTIIVVPEKEKGKPSIIRTTYGPPSSLD